MKLPHKYKGFEIHGAKSKATGSPMLEVRRPMPEETSCGYIVIKNFLPLLHTIYLGYESAMIAYDQDIIFLEKFIDNYLLKIQTKILAK